MTVKFELEDEHAEWLKELMRNSFCRYPQDENEYDKYSRLKLFDMLNVIIPDE